MYETVPPARSSTSTSGDTITARTISTSNGAPAPRSMVRRTAVSLGPRMRPRASSTVSPSSAVPSMWVMTSPGRRPALSAGESVIGATTTSRQSGASVVHDAVLPLASTVPIVAPMPSNSPEMSWRVARNSSDVRYAE